MNRRRFLAFAAWGAASTFLPRVAAAARFPDPWSRSLAFHHLHTGERFEACYWEHGAYVPEALERIDTILRDFRTGDVRRIDPRLLDVVHSLKVRLETTAPAQVICGYRSPATNSLLRAADPSGVAERSLHLTGEAVDICFEDRPLRSVRDAALSLGAGGVGYYPGSGFVHLDIGRPRRW
jgi:uncharacterized protein YcbK (DUF882 family)